MAFYALSKDGLLVGITYENPYQFNLVGVSIHEFDGKMPDLNSSVWHSELEEFVQAPGLLSKLDFLNRFTLEERLAIRASTDTIVFDIMKLLEAADFIDVTNQSTIQGVQYLAIVGLIASTRISEVLT